MRDYKGERKERIKVEGVGEIATRSINSSLWTLQIFKNVEYKRY